MPGTPDNLRKSVAASTYHAISAASTNAAVVKASAGVVTGYYISNRSSGFRAVKLYNKATSPTVGTDTPRVVLDIPFESAANIALDPPLAFETGIGIAIVTGIADSDATAVGANEVAVSLYYL